MFSKGLGGMDGFKRSPYMLVALDVFTWILAPLFFEVSSFVDSRVERCRLWVAVSCRFLQPGRCKHCIGIEKHVKILICDLKSKLKNIRTSYIHVFRSGSVF